MSSSNYKKVVKTNNFVCGCCFNGERNPKCKQHKKRLRQQGKKEVRKELNENQKEQASNS